MNTGFASQVGSAFVWKIIQFAAIKIIFLARTLVLARLLVPADFGLLAVAMIAVDFLMTITDFGMIPALVQHAHADEAHYHAAWTINLTRALLISVSVFVAAPLIASLFNEPRSVDLIRVLALRPALDSFASIKLAQLTRNLHFQALTINRLAETLTNTILAIMLAPFLGVWALIIGTLGGQVAHVISSYVLAPYRPRLSFEPDIVRPLVSFGQWVFLGKFAAVIASSVLQVIIARKLGAHELGIYFLAAKLAFIPAEVTTEVVGSVAFPMFARLQGDLQRAAHIFRTTLLGILILIMPISLLMIILAPSLVKDILGANWEGTVPLIRVFGLVTIIGLLGDVIVPLLNGMGQPRRVAIMDWVQSSLLIVFMWTLIDLFGAVGAALAWLPSVFISQFIGIYSLRQQLPRPFATLHTPLFVLLIGLIVFAGVILTVDSLINGIPGIVFSTLIGLLTLGMIMNFFDQRCNLGLVRNFMITFPQMAQIIRMLRLQ